MAKVEYSSEARRARVFGGAGALVFVLAFALCLIAYGLSVWRDSELLTWAAGVGLALFVLPILCLIRPFWMLTSAQRPGFLEGVVRLLLLFLFWVGSLWYLLLFAYLALQFASSSGLLLALIHQ